MEKWINWWKDKTFLMVVVAAIIAILFAYGMAKFYDWGWVVSLIIGAAGGLLIRRVVINKLKDKEGGNG